MTPHQRPSNRPPRRNKRTRDRRRSTGNNSRFAALVVIAIITVATLAATGVISPAGSSDAAESPGIATAGASQPQSQPQSQSTQDETQTAQSTVSESAAKTPAPEQQISHVTFGAHTAATQPCDTCHTDKPTTEIACRACHGTSCGKDAKSASDCLVCHETGTTDEWVVD